MPTVNALQGKVALITGSTSGIGWGIAQSLAAQGVQIMLNGLIDPGAANELVTDLKRRFQVDAHFHPADMTKPAEIAQMALEATNRLGRVDILVNNAGIQHVAPIEEFPIEKWDAILAINLSSAFHTTRACLPQMRERNWGRIINIASVHGLVASAHKAAYVAAKHGLIGLTKTTALETADSAITCNAICPGWVLTPLVQRQIENLAKAEGLSIEVAKAKLLSEKQPSKEFVTAEQIGEMVVFLCSPAASQMRGAALNMDGGWLAQ